LVVLALALSAAVSFAASGSSNAAQDRGPDTGLVIVQVDPKGPAAAAGVVRGDILQAVDGTNVDRVVDLTAALQTKASGDEVQLTVLHGDVTRILTATLSENNGRAYLGVVPYAAPAVEEPAPNVVQPMATSGALIVEVVDGSPAAAAGLTANQVILSVDGQAVDESHSLSDLIGGREPGDSVTLQVAASRTDQETQDIAVTLGENPDRAGIAYLGVRYSVLPAALSGAQRMMPFDNDDNGQGENQTPPDETPMPGMPFGRGFNFQMPGMQISEGAVIRQVTQDSPAASAGLQARDVITAVDGQDVATAQELVDAIGQHKPGDTVVLAVDRPGQNDTLEITVTLGENPDTAGKAYLGVTLGNVFMRFQDNRSNDQNGEGSTLPFELPFDLNQLPHPFQFQMPNSSVEGQSA
jgi:S1-C subfamily serine protease